MRVFMLGWEFPPYISGGLGTACHGLTRAMSRRGISVTFVLPRPVTPRSESHGDGRAAKVLSPPHAGAHIEGATWTSGQPGFENVTFRTVPAHLLSPYQRVSSTAGSAAGPVAGSVAGSRMPRDAGSEADALARERWAELDRRIAAHAQAAEQPRSVLHEPEADRARHGGAVPGSNKAADAYGGDLLAEADRYARLCVELARRESFDVIHAHDWLSFPAGMAVAAATGKPLIVHVHSTEFDRAGENIQQPIYDIERRGMHAAMRVITVSYFTRSLIDQRYGIDPERIEVVYNGIETEPPEMVGETASDGSATAEASDRSSLKRTVGAERVVLFLGRVTRQKGPCYFIKAAEKVLEKMERVKFVMTGSGDQVPEMIELAARRGIGHKIHFTGFLEGAELERVFHQADVYVMPSVSEPFGLAALEALRHDVPAIVSRTSGVSEALKHVLKVDFWNTDEIAEKIIAVLSHPSLVRTLCGNADRELHRFTWDAAAHRCRRIYEEVIATMAQA